ncbi:MAG: DnaJ domain-containing protein [Sphingomicrobium sp.]
MSHYDTLRVVPWAEDAVIRAAYRALMRLYHPDTNRDPEAQSRVRDITRAYAVLGDPEKRAAYDELPGLGNTIETAGPAPFFDVEQPSHPPLRKLGIASVGLALVMVVGIAVWPQSKPRPRPQEPRTATTRIMSAAGPLTAPQKVAAHVNGAQPVARTRDSAPVQPLSAQDGGLAGSNSHTATAPGRAEVADVAVSKAPASMPKRAMAQDRGSKPTASVPAATDHGAGNAAQAQPLASCRPAASKAAECTDGRQAQVERLATGLLKQSMEHADFQKQELLLSARNRSAYSRTLCHSSECVTETYLRQIRETTQIMQGRIPSP